jgi:hypothetical protein
MTAVHAPTSLERSEALLSETGPLPQPVHLDAEGWLVAAGLNPAEFKHRTRHYFEPIETFRSEAALLYYAESRYDPVAGEHLFRDTKAFLASIAALTSLGVDQPPAAPPSVREVGWPGFVLATADYAEASRRMGMFVHHDHRARQDDGAGLALVRLALPEVLAFD